MRDLTITAIIKVYQYDELNEADRALMQTAMEATARSYSPYSHFSVGAAALLGNGTVVTGTNQENAAYPLSLIHIFRRSLYICFNNCFIISSLVYCIYNVHSRHSPSRNSGTQ